MLVRKHVRHEEACVTSAPRPPQSNSAARPAAARRPTGAAVICGANPELVDVERVEVVEMVVRPVERKVEEPETMVLTTCEVLTAVGVPKMVEAPVEVNVDPPLVMTVVKLDVEMGTDPALPPPAPPVPAPPPTTLKRVVEPMVVVTAVPAEVKTETIAEVVTGTDEPAPPAPPAPPVAPPLPPPLPPALLPPALLPPALLPPLPLPPLPLPPPAEPVPVGAGGAVSMGIVTPLLAQKLTPKETIWAAAASSWHDWYEQSRIP